MKKTFTKILLILVAVIICCCPVVANAITISWDVPSSGVTSVDGYILYYGLAANKTEFNEQTIDTFLTLDNSKFQSGVSYYFTVKAYNSVGESGSSAEVEWILYQYIVIPENPAPVNIYIAPGSPVNINISE